MSGLRPQVRAGGSPTAAEAAALAAAVAALLDAERGGAAADPLPAAYRSRWRRLAALDAVRPMPGPELADGVRR